MESLIQPHEKTYIQNNERPGKAINSKTLRMQPNGRVTAKVHLGLGGNPGEMFMANIDHKFMVNPTEVRQIGGDDYILVWKT